MVRVRRRRWRRRGTLVFLLHAPSPLLRGGDPLHHRVFLLPSLLLLLMLFILVEGSHARPAPPLPRPLPPAALLPPPVGEQPGAGVSKWTVVLGRERPRPTEGFDSGKSSERRKNEVMSPTGTVLPWERTQPLDRPPTMSENGKDISAENASSESHPKDDDEQNSVVRGEKMGSAERGVNETSSSRNSVIKSGNGTLPIPIYGIMTDEVSGDVDLMLGGEGRARGGRVPNEDWDEELVMWRLTNHDRRKGQLEEDEELISRMRRTPRERTDETKVPNKRKKKKKDKEEGENVEGGGERRQGRRKGKRRPRWRERRRQEMAKRRRLKEGRGNKDRGGKGGKVGRGREGGGGGGGGSRKRRKDSMESNTRPINRRHKSHQLERFRQIVGYSSPQRPRPKGSRGGANPKNPSGSRGTGKSPRIEGPGSGQREVVPSGEGVVSSGSGNLEDGAARSERSANLSHITGTARKIQMYVKNRNLQIDPWGRVSGAEDDDSDYTILQRTSVSNGRLKIQGVATCLFLCMDRCGLLYGSKNFTEECVWNEMIEQLHYNTYSSVAYSNEDRALYLALNGAGKPRRVQVHRKDGKGMVLGKLSTYARVLTRPVTQPRIQRLALKLLEDRQRDAVMAAVVSAGGSIPGYSNVTTGGPRALPQIGAPTTHQPTSASLVNFSLEPSANPSTALSSILSSLGVDPSVIPPDFNLDSITFADHPLRHHGYHQLCPMPLPDMVTSGSELVGKHGKVLCKKKENAGRNGGGKGKGGGGDGKKKKKNNEKDGQKRRKRKGQAKDVGEVEEKNKRTGGRQGGKRKGGGGSGGGGGGGGGGGSGRGRGNGGGRGKKEGEKRKVGKRKGEKEKKGERKGERKGELSVERKGELNVERKGDLNAERNGERSGERTGERNGEKNGERKGEAKRKKKTNKAARERERQRKRERNERRRKRIRKRLCGIGGRPRKDKDCDRKKKRHRRGKDEVHHENILHNNTLEEKVKFMDEEDELEGVEEMTEAPFEWEEDEEGEGEEGEIEENTEEEEVMEKSNEVTGKEIESDEEEEEEDEEFVDEDAEEDEEDDEEGNGDEDEKDDEDEDDDDDEDDYEEEGEDSYEDDEDNGAENDGKGVNIRRKRKKENAGLENEREKE